MKRFIYASSSSVYGIKDDQNVTEDLPLEPLTDYSKYKAMCEEVLAKERDAGGSPCVIRPSTVCGYSPRQRLDVVVNILTNHAFNNAQDQGLRRRVRCAPTCTSTTWSPLSSCLLQAAEKHRRQGL